MVEKRGIKILTSISNGKDRPFCLVNSMVLLSAIGMYGKIIVPGLGESLQNTGKSDYEPTQS